MRTLHRVGWPLGPWFGRAALVVLALMLVVAGPGLPARALPARAGGAEWDRGRAGATGSASPDGSDGRGGAQFFPVESVRPGLTGYGLTVVEGERIDRFDVEVLGVLRQAGPAGDLILVRVSGEPIEKAGGIAAGMSGSPVYVDGKLVGAIGFAFEMSDHSVGLVTPISDMIQVLEMVPRRAPGSESEAAKAGPEAAGTGAEAQPQAPGPAPEDSTEPGLQDEPAAPGEEPAEPEAEPKAPGGEPTAPGDEPVAPGDEPEGPPPAELGPQSGTAGAPRWAALASSAEEARRLLAEAPPGSLVFAPVATPVLASGLGERTFQRLSSYLEPLGLRLVRGAGAAGAAGVAGAAGRATAGAQGRSPAATGAAAAGEAAGAEAEGSQTQTLVPGSAFGLQLIRGDVDLTAIGTVTYVEGERFVGFGHPFIQRGSSEFFATTAYIHRTVPSINVPFKLGAPGERVGVVTEDRRAAVGGALGRDPAPIGLTVEVEDLDVGRTRTFRMELVRDEQLSLALAAIGALEGFDRSLDRIGAGTSQVVFEVVGDHLPAPGGRLTRANMFYSQSDIAARSLAEGLEGLDLLLNNPFRDVHVRQVSFRARIGSGRQTAKILEASPEKEQVSAGSSVLVEVTLLPFRGEPETRLVRLNVPADVPPGRVRVTVRGGAFFGLSALPSDMEALLDQQPPAGQMEEEGDLGNLGGEEPESLEKLLEEFVQRERSNQLVVEFYPGFDAAYAEEPAQEPAAAPSGGDGEAGRSPKQPEDKGSGKGKDSPASGQEAGRDAGEPVQSFLTTPFVIEGSTDFELEITPQEAPAGGGEG